MSKTRCYIMLDSVSQSGYFANIIKTELSLVDDIKDAVDFDTLESANALIDYVLPKPLIGSWKVIQQKVA